MLKFVEIGVIITIVVYGIIKLIEMFSSWNKTRKKGAALDELAKQADIVKQHKENILNETQKNKEQIDNINKTLK